MTEKTLRQYRDIKNERDHIEVMLQSFEIIYKRTEDKLDDDARKRYRAALQQLNDQLLAIERAIETLEPRERQAIRLHYIDGLSWEEVGYKMYYERSQIFRIRKAAIEKLKNV